MEAGKPKKIILPPHGTFRDYVAFYFGYRSPMLYNIYHGYNEVKRRSHVDIVYIVSSFHKIKTAGLKFVFFDGHGYHNLSGAFNSERDLTEIDWDVINARKWHDTEKDPDRKRRKQAEFLIYREVPLNALEGFGVFNPKALSYVQTSLKKYNISLRVKIKKSWYY